MRSGGKLKVAVSPTFSTTALSTDRSPLIVAASSTGMPPFLNFTATSADMISIGPSWMWAGRLISSPPLPPKYTPCVVEKPMDRSAPI